MTEEQQLSALLRIKRYEQPPPGYYQKLLGDVHRRQRSELLRRPLWQIAIERAQTFWGEHSMGNGSYAGAMAAVVLCGLALLGIALPQKAARSGGATVARVDASKIEPLPRPALVAAEPRVSEIEDDAPEILSLNPVPVVVAAELQRGIPANARLLPAQTNPQVAVRAPRYVIDARPASYEVSTVSFNF